ncbi:MAG: hypothetical protein JWO30_4293 [Fibrobacteres bacterium]|nr:hypothetical protein [Fibrobacterota bacterium]
MIDSMIRRSLSLLVLASALAGTGCDDSGSTAPAGNPDTHQGVIDACTLLTKAEAESIFGKAVLTVKGDTSSYITHCSYEGGVEPGAILGTRLSITTFTTASVQAGLDPHLTVPTYFANLKTATAPADRDSVAGVGTEAFWHKKPTKLSMYKGDVYVDISFSPFGKPVDTSAAARAGAITAGQRAAEKI